MHRGVRASRGLGGACTDNRADGGGRRRVVCLAPVPRGTSPSTATAGDALDDSGFGRYRRRDSRRGTRCVRTNRILAYSPSHLVVWPAAYQLCRPGLAPLGTEVRYFAVTVSLEGRSRSGSSCGLPGQAWFAHRLATAQCVWFPVRSGTRAARAGIGATAAGVWMQTKGAALLAAKTVQPSACADACPGQP
jgi:hypothetical protein